MPRRIFISYEGNDRMRAKGFRLLRWNKSVDVEFFDRHLLDPVKSRDPAYIRRCIREQMHGTSVLVVLIGENTHESDWVAFEIQEALENGKGVLGIKVKDSGPVQVPEPLVEAGAEVLNWQPDEFGDAIERAADAPKKVGSQASAPPESLSSSCART